ncbi:hypothetical protein BGX31_003931 [Mortierella sp. GBA43]|nr:hypothetical protein BGX31_003931 [Mortierella sp. GBA43]
MYVVGGYNFVMQQPLMDQAFAIDLSVSWSTDMPAYKSLASGALADVTPCGISPDGKKWVAIPRGYVRSYDIASDQWTDIKQVQNFTIVFPVSGAVDPDSGKLYVPFAITAQNNYPGAYMLVLDTNDPKTFITDTSNMATSAPIDHYGFTVAWSTAMKSLIYVGGASIYKYNPSTGWTDLRPLTSGQAPSGSRYYSCVVAGDSKIVVFGGQNKIANQTTLTDIYILDVLNMTWKQGQSVTQDQSRSMGPCAYSNNQFIAWGGVNTLMASETNQKPDSLTMVYNLETDTWTNNYTAPPRPAKTSIGAIVGGAVGGGLVAAVLVGYGVYRYRKRTHDNNFGENVDEKRSGKPADPHLNLHQGAVRDPTYIPHGLGSPGNPFVDPHQGYVYTYYPPVIVGGTSGKDHAAAFGLNRELGHPHTIPDDGGSKFQDTMSTTPSYYPPPPPAMRASLEGRNSPQTYDIHYNDKAELSETSNYSTYHPTTSDWRTNPLPPV